jgi:hypothetical protein
MFRGRTYKRKEKGRRECIPIFYFRACRIQIHSPKSNNGGEDDTLSCLLQSMRITTPSNFAHG